MGYTEAEVWNLTPRKWLKLVETHVELFKKQWGASDEKQKDAPTGFIDQSGL